MMQITTSIEIDDPLQEGERIRVELTGLFSLAHSPDPNDGPIELQTFSAVHVTSDGDDPIILTGPQRDRAIEALYEEAAR